MAMLVAMALRPGEASPGGSSAPAKPSEKLPPEQLNMHLSAGLKSLALLFSHGCLTLPADSLQAKTLKVGGASQKQAAVGPCHGGLHLAKR